APPDNRYTRAITLLLALVLGFAVAVSVLDLRREAAAEDSPRTLLEAEVRETRTEVEQLEQRRAELEGQIATPRPRCWRRARSAPRSGWRPSRAPAPAWPCPAPASCWRSRTP